MSIGAFFAMLGAKIASGASEWLKVFFKSDKGGVREASPDVITKYGKMRAKRDINVININPTIVVDPTAQSYSKEQINEMLSEVGKQISDHIMGLKFEENFQLAVKDRASIELTEEQKNIINLFEKAGWTKDKIASLVTAFRIVNLEDSGRIAESECLMNTAFSGRKEEKNRKMYNLTRSGYIDRFVIDLKFMPLSWTNEKVTKILEYFPDAVFIDREFIPDDMITELLRREKDSISRVTLFARGKARIEIMERGYNRYLAMKIDKADNDPSEERSSKQILLFMFDRKMPYKIAETEAELIELYKKEYVLRK